MRGGFNGLRVITLQVMEGRSIVRFFNTVHVSYSLWKHYVATHKLYLMKDVYTVLRWFSGEFSVPLNHILLRMNSEHKSPVVREACGTVVERFGFSNSSRVSYLHTTPGTESNRTQVLSYR